jgi:hypothetical protein
MIAINDPKTDYIKLIDADHRITRHQYFQFAAKINPKPSITILILSVGQLKFFFK